MTGGLVDSDFPSYVLHPERVLFRIHRTINDPVHFSSDDRSRFNLTTTPGSGTCYLATSPLGAYVETFGRLGTITELDVEERSLSELALSADLRLADLTERRVLGGYGVAGDMSAGTDYLPTHQLAGELYSLGFDGIYYTARHDPAFQERSVAVFGGSGDDKLFAQTTGPIPASLISEAETEFDLVVLPRL